MQRPDRKLGSLCSSTAPFDAIYGSLFPTFDGPSASWVSYPDLYRADCRTEGEFTWLEVDEVSSSPGGRFRIGGPPGRAWGTHLTEVNDAAGNLLKIVGRQAKVWLTRRGTQRRSGR